MERPTDQLKEWEWIEQYWAGRLSEPENAFFEQLMKTDDRFSHEVASLRDGVEALETARMEQHIRQRLHQLRNTDQRRLLRVRWLGVGVGLAAACLAFFLFVFLKPVALPGYENDWEMIRNLSGTYRTNSADSLTRHRKQAFDQFFEAQAFFVEGQSASAARQFERVLTYPNLRPYFRETVEWHLVVCYVKTSQFDRARELYDHLSDKTAYDISPLDRWHLGWQIRLGRWFGR